jgi:hypothetical protein
MTEPRQVLAKLEIQGRLTGQTGLQQSGLETLDDESLVTELAVDTENEDDNNVLRHVSSREERRAGQEIANRVACRDFERFKPLFQEAENHLLAGRRQSEPFGKDASIATGALFTLGSWSTWRRQAMRSRRRIVRTTHDRGDLLQRNRKQSAAQVTAAWLLQR